MRKTLSGKSLSDRKEALLHVRANHKLKPKEFYEKLHGPLRDLELSSKPSSYPKQIERLKKQAQAYLALLVGHKQVFPGNSLPAILSVEKSTAARILLAHGAIILALREKAIRDMRWADQT
jgi:hypothetical protein